MITVELTETDYKRIMSALVTVNEDPYRDVSDLIKILKKSHDRFVRAKELSSAHFLVQQAYNKCNDIGNSADFMSAEEFSTLRRSADSLYNAMNEINRAILFQKQAADAEKCQK